MSAVGTYLIELAESVERELGCEFSEAFDLVQAELESGTAHVDVFDVIVDRHVAAEIDGESFSDRFLNAVLDKGTLWLLYGVGVLVVIDVIAQLVMWVQS